MAANEGRYLNLVKDMGLKWTWPRGEPRGVEEVRLHEHKDGSYSHILRIKAGVEISEPVSHEFYEEAYYISGEMLNVKTRKKIRAGDYVLHSPGELHGPFKCLKTCLILEFRYYK